MINRRDLDAADRPDGVLLLGARVVLLQDARNRPDERTGLLLLEQQADDVGVLEVGSLRVSSDAVDDREVDIREVAGHRADRLRHEESDADNEVVASGGVGRQVGDIVGVGVRLGDVPLDAELAFAAQAGAYVSSRRRVGQTDPRQVIEALVSKRAGIGDEADLDDFWCRRRAGAGAVTARGQDDRQRQRYAKT